MPTIRTATATATSPLLAANPVPTTIQKSLIAIANIALETRIDCEMMATPQRETDITNEIDGTTIAEIAIEKPTQEVVVIASLTPSCPPRQPLLSAVLVLWPLLLMAQTLPPKDVIVSTKSETEIEREKETETGIGTENATIATVNKDTTESSASTRENSEIGSATSVNTKENAIETWIETARRNEKELTSARHVIVKDTERGKGIDPGTLRRLKAAKTGIAARDATARSELIGLLHKKKTQDLPLTSDNAHPSLITIKRPTSGNVFPSANGLFPPNLQRLTLTKIIAVAWNRPKETWGCMITQTRKGTDARAERSLSLAGLLRLLCPPTWTIPKTKAEKTEYVSLSLHPTEKTLSRSRVS